MEKPEPKIYFVLGEESGDALGVELFDELNRQLKGKVSVVGLAGMGLSQRGVQSPFDIEDISVMGVSAVFARLPKIIRRVKQTVSDIVANQPNVIVLIDSPDFTHAVAKRVRKKMPDVPIINYICPSVWAWRPQRAQKMKAYVDHVLAILPFEPRAMKELNGPETTYIGHPLARKIASQKKSKQKPAQRPQLLVLPGSRNSELNRMLEPFRQTVAELANRGVDFEVVIPAVSKVRSRIEQEAASWSPRPTIVDSSQNDSTFPLARAALATSGTVSLQLALHRVPMVICYKMDPLAKPLRHMIKIWSVVLPNLIVDRLLVPEEINDMVQPKRIARRLERLFVDTPERQMQLDGFTELAAAMKTKKPPSELAASIIIQHIG